MGDSAGGHRYLGVNYQFALAMADCLRSSQVALGEFVTSSPPVSVPNTMEGRALGFGIARSIVLRLAADGWSFTWRDPAPYQVQHTGPRTVGDGDGGPKPGGGYAGLYS